MTKSARPLTRCVSNMLFLLATLGATASAQAEFNPFSRAAQQNFQGYFESPAMQLYCHADDSGYVGRIIMQGRSLPFRAQSDNGALRGAFQNGQEYFSFTASINKNQLTLKTDGHQERLTRTKLPSLAGHWVGNKLHMILDEQQGFCTGSIRFSGTDFSLKGTLTAGVLQGQFNSGGVSYPFTLEQHKDRLVFISDAYREEVFPENNSQLATRKENEYNAWRKQRQLSLQGLVAIAPQWKEVGDFHEGLAKFQNEAGQFGFIDTAGQVVVPAVWKEARSFSQGLAPVKSLGSSGEVTEDESSSDQKWGYIDRSGRLVIPTRFASAERFSDNYGSVAVYINMLGRETLSESGTPVSALIDRTGQTVSLGSGNQKLAVPEFVEGLSVMEKENFSLVGENWQGKGFVNREFDFVIKSKFLDAGKFSDGLAPAKSKKKKLWGFINVKGKFVIEPQWASALSFSEGLAIVIDENGKFGAIDRSGRVVIPLKWKKLAGFSNGCTWAQDDSERIGHLNRNGQPLPGFGSWSSALDFHEGVAVVQKDGKHCGLINTQGTLIVPAIWAKLQYSYEGLCRLQSDEGTWGFLRNPLHVPTSVNVAIQQPPQRR